MSPWTQTPAVWRGGRRWEAGGALEGLAWLSDLLTGLLSGLWPWEGRLQGWQGPRKGRPLIRAAAVARGTRAEPTEETRGCVCPSACAAPASGGEGRGRYPSVPELVTTSPSCVSHSAEMTLFLYLFHEVSCSSPLRRIF